jgi:asparagine synthase (glutamine-hydrolysing)
MCGIAGVIGKPDGLSCVLRMTAAIGHRGPDGEGYFTGEGVVLGHKRLAILDLSRAGAQPMRSHDGRWTMALNGEIFNYRELRSELRRELPSEFASATDTEVLLEACAAWGVEKALQRSIGMFAFALWDERNRELTLARDRCGEKPLVYFWDGATFAFASELKALRALHSSHLDPAAVDAYLALGYVPAPLAIFRDCRKLPPGHLLRFRNRSVSVDRWWFPESAVPPAGRTRPQRIHELRTRIEDAVHLRLRADVPVALALSGGVDSSVIAAECARQHARLDSFTIAFDGDDTGLAHASAVATQLHLTHHVIRTRAESAASQMQDAAAHYDEPFADSSALPSLELARALQRRYKVILNGDGGDEAFAGYRHYERIQAKQWLKRAAAMAGFRDGAGSVGVYVQSKTVFRLSERARLLAAHATGDTFSILLGADAYLRHAGKGCLRRALWSDRHLYLPNDLTYKTDIALGAFGIESRAPFLDHRLLEWAQGLDSGDLVRGREKKVLLREAYRNELPPAVLDQPKQGFGAPIHAWLAGPLAELRREFLPCPLLDPASQTGASGQRLWSLLTFSLWARAWKATW